MTERAAEGTWVEVRWIVLPAGERAAAVPEDTQRVPLEAKARGFLAHPASVGEEAEIRTAAGRRLRGTLTEIEPAYRHGFGVHSPELASIGAEVRALIEARGPSR